MPPIHTVPPEVLLNIFSQGITDAEYVSATHHVAPWVLTQVCRDWRRLAVVAHELWCSFALDTERMNDSLVQMMSTWISRSGNLPLAVSLSMTFDEEGWLDEVACRSAFAILVQYASRWKDIDFTWLGHDTCPLIDALGQGLISTPLLESFCMDTMLISNGVDSPRIEAYISRLLHDAPQLRTFMWYDEHIKRRHEVNWQHLTLPGALLCTLNLECDLSPEEIVGLLAQCPVLDSADFCVAIPFNVLCGTPQPLTHATLRELSIKFCDQIRPLFDLLALPALRDLRLQDYSGDDTVQWQHVAFQNFLQRSGCELLCLSMVLWVNFTQESLLRTLEKLPSLEYFCLHDQKRDPPGCVGNELLLQLCWNTGPDGGFRLCPNLQGFALIGVFGAPITPGLLPSVIYSRRCHFPPGVGKMHASNSADLWVALESAHLPTQDILLLRIWQRQGWLRVDFDSAYGEDIEMAGW